MKEYQIEQFPKNKRLTGLSKKQLSVRNKKRIEKLEKPRVCIKCGVKQDIKEFYPRYYPGTRKVQNRRKTCRDCIMKRIGVVEIGKYRFSAKLLKKKFRRCSVCKTIKPLKDFPNSKKTLGGHAFNCSVCSYNLSQNYIKTQREKIGNFFIRQYALLKYNKRIKTQEEYQKYKNEIIENRKPNYFIDGFEFVTLAEFARYIEKTYNIMVGTVEKRIEFGANELECTLPEKEYRSLKSGTNKGKIKVTDTITGEEFLFKNTREDGLLKMFGSSLITEGIKTGLPVGGKRSKYKNPCLIVRL